MIDKRQFIGKYCDIQTKDGVWRLGIIDGGKGNKDDKDIIEVTLDGWSSNKNQKVCIHSNRIQPPRYYSKGYTGQISVPLRNLNFDITNISYIVNWLKLFHNFDFQNIPILEITNIFRCQMFILVDSIIFHPWNLVQKEQTDDNLKKVESLFNNIVHVSVLYLEKLPKFVQELANINYDKHTYLQSHCVCYLEASYEIFIALKSIFNFTKRSEKFFTDYKDILKINYVNEFIDLGCINLMNRLWKEFKHHKLFEDKFYLVANIIHLNISIFNKSNHFKLSKANQIKYINEIVNFLYREGYVDNFSKNKNDPDVASTIEAFIIFSKNNKNFVNESQRFSGFLRSITRNSTECILPISPLKKIGSVGPRRILSHNNVVTLNSTNIGTAKPIPSLFARFEKRDSNKSVKESLEKEKEFLLKDEISIIKEDAKEFSISHNPDYARKLSDIERKLTKLEDKITSNTNNFTTAKKKPFSIEFQRTPCTEFNIISPVKEKQNESCTDYKITINELDACLYINGKNSSTPISDPFDENGILSLIDQSIMCNNMERAKSIIIWRKRILEISKCNGWVVGKILAFNTIKKLHITDQDIIEANLLFMEKYNLIGKQARENFNLEIDFQSLLKEYETELKESVKNLSNLSFNE